MTKVATQTKTSPAAKKIFQSNTFLQKVIHPEYEIMKTGQGEKIYIIYLDPSVAPKEEENKKGLFFLL